MYNYREPEIFDFLPVLQIKGALVSRTPEFLALCPKTINVHKEKVEEVQVNVPQCEIKNKVPTRMLAHPLYTAHRERGGACRWRAYDSTCGTQGWMGGLCWAHSKGKHQVLLLVLVELRERVGIRC